MLAALGGALVACSGGGGGKASPGPATTLAPVVVPGPGQAFLTGDTSRFVADDAQAPKPLASPFTLSATERGTGSATIENAIVGGKRSTISWGTGTPLPITSTAAGGIELGAAHIEVDATGATWGIDGVARTFLPGAYRAGAPVAVGIGGIAAPLDAVDFTADTKTVLISRGGVVVHLPPGKVELAGPGKLAVTGRLKVRTPTGEKPAAAVTFGPGPFTATLLPAPNGATLDSVLQGSFTAT